MQDCVMEYDNEKIRNFINRILKNASAYNLDIEGDLWGKWFIIRDANLASFFSEHTTKIMVKFETDNKIVILFPESVTIDFSVKPYICPLFLSKHTYIKNWRQVCPCLTEQVLKPNIENIAVLLQFIQNPILCGIHGCDWQVAYEKLWADFEYEWPGD